MSDPLPLSAEERELLMSSSMSPNAELVVHYAKSLWSVRDLVTRYEATCAQLEARVAQLEAALGVMRARHAVYVRCNRRILKKHGWDVPDGVEEKPDFSPMLHHPDLPGGMFDDRAAFDMHFVHLKSVNAQFEARVVQLEAELRVKVGESEFWQTTAERHQHVLREAGRTLEMFSDVPSHVSMFLVEQIARLCADRKALRAQLDRLTEAKPCRLCEAGICSKHQPRHIFDAQRVAPSRGEEESR